MQQALNECFLQTAVANKSKTHIHGRLWKDPVLHTVTEEHQGTLQVEEQKTLRTDTHTAQEALCSCARVWLACLPPGPYPADTTNGSLYY